MSEWRVLLILAVGFTIIAGFDFLVRRFAKRTGTEKDIVKFP